MTQQASVSVWLTPRFWGLSLLFWFAFTVLAVMSQHFAFNVGDGVVDLRDYWFQTYWPMAAYWLVTPPMFEWARRIERQGLPARSYYKRLLAAVVSLAVVVGWAQVSNGDGRWDQWGFFRCVLAIAAMSIPYGIRFLAIMAVAMVVNQFRASQLRQQELLAAQLSVLRSQLQPHFLFNTLQAIAVTIKQDPKTAVSMVALLGDLLRQTLRPREGNLVSLQEELQLLQPYLELQQLRFADRLSIEVDTPNEVLGALLPDLILQPLLENALQHGVESKPGEGKVRIRVRRSGAFLELEVADDGTGPDSDAVADGIGLGATRARLDALFGDRAQLQLSSGGLAGAVVTIRMPWQEVADAA